MELRLVITTDECGEVIRITVDRKPIMLGTKMTTGRRPNFNTLTECVKP